MVRAVKAGSKGAEKGAGARGRAVSALLCCLAANVWAQSVPSPEAAALEGLRRQEERSRTQQEGLQPKTDVLKPPSAHASSPDDLPVEDPCLVVRELRFEGKDSEHFSWLAGSAQPYLNRCLGVQGLARIAALLDKKLVEGGFATTRVSFPAQNLQPGTLRVHIHVGRISAIRMVDHPAGQVQPAWGTWKNAFPVSTGDILNIRDLEQGVEQMKRLPSQSVTTQLEPGAEPDTSVLVIQRRPGTWSERLRGGVTLDNSGGGSLGRAQFSGHLTLDNPLGLNDVLSASLSSNAEHPSRTHRSQSLGVSYSIPAGYSTLSLSASHTRFAQYVQGTTVRFLSSGSSQTAEARLHRTVWRSSSSKLGVYGAISLRRAESFLDDVELIVQRRRTTSSEVGVSFKRLLQDGWLEFDLGHRRGVPWDAQEDLVTAADGGPTLRPRLWLFSAGYAKGFDIGDGALRLQYIGTLRAQYTPNATLSVDQMAIGGRHSVRGFDGDSVLIAENGWQLRNEWATPVQLHSSLRDTALFLGADVGRVWGPSDINLLGRKLAGATVGVRGRLADVQFQLSLATPLSRPQGFRTQHVSVYASVSHAF